MIARFLCLLTMSAFIMAGGTALVYGGGRGWVVALASAVLAAYAGLLASIPADRPSDDR